jgi:hypothetical protein
VLVNGVQGPVPLQPTWGLVSSPLTVHFVYGFGCVGSETLVRLDVIHVMLTEQGCQLMWWGQLLRELQPAP